MVEVTVAQHLEGLNGLRDRHEDAGETGEHLGYEEWLAQEALDPPGPVDGDAVLFGQLVETKNGNDVL